MNDHAAPLATLQSYLVTLGRTFRQIGDAEASTLEACRLLGQFVSAGQVVFAKVEYGQREKRHYWDNPGKLRGEGEFSLSYLKGWLIEELADGDAVVVRNTATDPRMSRAYWSVAIGAFVVVPVMRDERLVAVLAVHNSEPTNWNGRQILATVETANLVGGS
jgi:GAF domain-containing protein